MSRSRLAIAIACLIAGALAATVACGSFSGSSDNPGDASDAGASQDGTASEAATDGSIGPGADAATADAGSQGCKDAPDAALCIDFDEADPQTAFVYGAPSGLLPAPETTGGGQVGLVDGGGVSPPNALFAGTPAHDGGAVARVRRPSYQLGSLAGRSAIRAEFDWFVEALPSDVGGSVTFLEIGLGIGSGTCRIALQQSGAMPVLNFICPDPVTQQPILFPTRGSWVHVTMRLTLDPQHLKGSIAIGKLPLVETVERATPVNPGDIYLVFGVDTSDGQSAPVRAGLDNIAIYLE